MKIFKQPLFFAALAVFAVGFALLAGFQLDIDTPQLLAGLAFAGVGDIEDISKKIEGIEASLTKFQEQAKLEIENTGKVSTETKNALDKMLEHQQDIAARLLSIEQKGGSPVGSSAGNSSYGAEFTNSASYKDFQNNLNKRAWFEIDNTAVTTATFPAQADRQPGIVPGAQQKLTLESFLPSMPTSAGAIEYVREVSFTNAAAETAENVLKPESAITFELKTMPVATVAHWIPISKQIAQDAPMLAAYINSRMVYGVNRRVEQQLAVGDGTAPNVSGLFDTGNFTAHGIANAVLGATLKKLVLIRKIIATLETSGYTPDAILLNPADWGDMDIELLTTVAMQARVSVDERGNTRIWGLPVITSVGVAADTFLVGAFQQACTKFDRESMTVDIFEQDVDNVRKNMLTLRAERRLALTVEVPAAIVGGDLTPV